MFLFAGVHERSNLARGHPTTCVCLMSLLRVSSFDRPCRVQRAAHASLHFTNSASRSSPQHLQSAEADYQFTMQAAG